MSRDLAISTDPPTVGCNVTGSKHQGKIEGKKKTAVSERDSMIRKDEQSNEYDSRKVKKS